VAVEAKPRPEPLNPGHHRE